MIHSRIAKIAIALGALVCLAGDLPAMSHDHDRRWRNNRDRHWGHNHRWDSHRDRRRRARAFRHYQHHQQHGWNNHHGYYR